MSNDLLNFNINFDKDKPQGGALRNDFSNQQGGYTNQPKGYGQPQNPYAGNQPNPTQGFQSQSELGFNQGNGGNRGYAPVMKTNDDSTMASEEGEFALFDLSKSSHPAAGAFHILFKALTIVSYLFLDSIIDKRVITFIFVVIFAACDFWTVKNVSGRLLVGLRWWSEILEDGTEKWHFESHGQNVKFNHIDKRIFWWTQMGAGAFWALICFLKLISFNVFWGVCSGICLCLVGTNYWGYHKCSKDQQSKLTSFVSNQRSKLFEVGLSTLTKGFGFFGKK